MSMSVWLVIDLFARRRILLRLQVSKLFELTLNILEERLQMLMVTIGKLTCRNTA